MPCSTSYIPNNVATRKLPQTYPPPACPPTCSAGVSAHKVPAAVAVAATTLSMVTTAQRR
eukprot:4374607-Prorocentrum_lima.AAC.1